MTDGCTAFLTGPGNGSGSGRQHWFKLCEQVCEKVKKVRVNAEFISII